MVSADSYSFFCHRWSTFPPPRSRERRDQEGARGRWWLSSRCQELLCRPSAPALGSSSCWPRQSPALPLSEDHMPPLRVEERCAGEDATRSQVKGGRLDSIFQIPLLCRLPCEGAKLEPGSEEPAVAEYIGPVSW